MRLLGLFVIVIGLCFCLSKEVVETSTSRKLFWTSNHAGMFSQFLQAKLMYAVSQESKRGLVLAPIKSQHYGDLMVNICDFFDFSGHDITCSPIPQNLNCIRKLSETAMTSAEENLCYEGPFLFRNMGAKTIREAVVNAVNIPVPLKMQDKTLKEYTKMKSSFVKNNEPYTVVHWRRGDQLTPQRCGSNLDTSVNCGSGKDLINKIKQFSKDKTVYIATNEHQDSQEMEVLRKEGYHTLSSIGQNQEYAKLDQFSVLANEVMLMLDATTFLAFGISEIDDVVEHERSLKNKSHCVAHEPFTVVGNITWCTLLKNDAPKKITVLKSSEVAVRGKKGALLANEDNNSNVSNNRNSDNTENADNGRSGRGRNRDRDQQRGDNSNNAVDNASAAGGGRNRMRQRNSDGNDKSNDNNLNSRGSRNNNDGDNRPSRGSRNNNNGNDASNNNEPNTNQRPQRGQRGGNNENNGGNGRRSKMGNKKRNNNNNDPDGDNSNSGGGGDEDARRVLTVRSTSKTTLNGNNNGNGNENNILDNVEDTNNNNNNNNGGIHVNNNNMPMDANSLMNIDNAAANMINNNNYIIKEHTETTNNINNIALPNDNVNNNDNRNNKNDENNKNNNNNNNANDKNNGNNLDLGSLSSRYAASNPDGLSETRMKQRLNNFKYTPPNDTFILTHNSNGMKSSTQVMNLIKQKGEYSSAVKLNKTAFSNQARLIFIAGLEGTGHHALQAMFRVCVKQNLCEPDFLITKRIMQFDMDQNTNYGLFGSSGTDTAIGDITAIENQMDFIKKKGGDHLYFLGLGFCPGAGMLSYPNFNGRNKPLDHPDVFTLALLAESAGLDFRVIVLQRSGAEILASTEKRGFGGRFGTVAETKILLDNAAVLYHQLSILDKRFYKCAQYRKLGNMTTEQKLEFIDFIHPTNMNPVFHEMLKEVVYSSSSSSSSSGSSSHGSHGGGSTGGSSSHSGHSSGSGGSRKPKPKPQPQQVDQQQATEGRLLRGSKGSSSRSKSNNDNNNDNDNNDGDNNNDTGNNDRNSRSSGGGKSNNNNINASPRSQQQGGGSSGGGGGGVITTQRGVNPNALINNKNKNQERIPEGMESDAYHAFNLDARLALIDELCRQ